PHPAPALFPYTTLFRSHGSDALLQLRIDLIGCLEHLGILGVRGMVGLKVAGHVIQGVEGQVGIGPDKVPATGCVQGNLPSSGLRSEEHTSELQTRENLV